MKTAIYTLTSELHDEQAVNAVTTQFLSTIGISYDLKGSDFSDFGTHALDLIYVRTGGTEGIFRRLLPTLRKRTHRQPFRLLTSGKSNSLAASLEILSYLRQQGIQGEVIHGSEAYVCQRLQLLERVGEARRQLVGCRLGVIGEPSDWLISSHANRHTVLGRCGIELIDISMQELQATIDATPLTTPDLTSNDARIAEALPGAYRIYLALHTIISRHRLQGFTLRCFDLLTSVHNTGCLALAKLNSEGFVAGCEGDVPAMLTMMIARSLTGLSGFQANPASIDPEAGELLMAHCTIPFNMLDRYELDTHYESGIGVGIRGFMKEGPVTIFKVSGDIQRCFIAEGTLLYNQSEPDLCRTQQVIRLDDKSLVRYFLTDPIGNHHIVLPGRHGQLLQEIMK